MYYYNNAIFISFKTKQSKKYKQENLLSNSFKFPLLIINLFFCCFL